MSEAPMELSPLTEDDLQTLRACVSYYCELHADLGTEPAEDEDTPEMSDHLVRWWHAQPESERPEQDMMENVLGAALGEYLRFILKLKWARVKDEDGESIVLVSEDAEAEIVMSPFDTIAEYLPEHPDGFVADFVGALLDSELMAGMDRDPDEEIEPLFPEEEGDEE